MRVGDIIKFDIPDPGDLGFKRIKGVGLVVDVLNAGEKYSQINAAVLCKGKISLVGVPKYGPLGFEVLNETR